MNRKYLYIVVPILLLVIVSALFLLNKKPLSTPGNNISPSEAAKEGDHSFDLKKITLDGVDGLFEVKAGVVLKDGVSVPDSSPEYGRALRVAYFYRLMKEEPLLYSETMDLTDFKNAQGILGGLEDKILVSMASKTSIFARTFSDAIYKSSVAFDAFNNEPGEKTAKSLIGTMYAANRAYSREVDDLQSKLIEINAEAGGNQKLSMLGGENFTSASVIISDLAKLRLNSQSQKNEISRREACLSDMSTCRFGEPILGKAAGPAAPLAPISELSINNTSPVRGPYQVESRCWKGYGQNSLYVSSEDSMHGFIFPKFYLATKGYFSEIYPQNGSFESYLYEKGVRVIPQSGATTYMCPDLEYKSEVMTLDYFKTSKKIFASIASDDLDSEGREVVGNGIHAEDKFFDAKTASEGDLNDLGSAYWDAYRYFGRKGDIEQREKMLDRFLKIKERLVGYPGVMREVAYYLSTYWDEKDHHAKQDLPIFIYMLKSNYSVSFMNASPNVYVLDSKPKYFAEDNSDGIIFGILSYADTINKFGLKKISAWLSIFKKYDRADRERYYGNLK